MSVTVIWGFFVIILYKYIYISLRKFTGSLGRQTKQNVVNPDFLPKGHLITMKTTQSNSSALVRLNTL